MTQCLSDQQRRATVRDFITYCINGKVKITDYTLLAGYLNDKQIMMLGDIKPTGTKIVLVSPDSGYQTIPTGLYDQNDARRYFDWLMSVVAGSIKQSEDITNLASDQLFSLLFVMRDKIEVTKDVELITPYDWQVLFTSFDKRLAVMKDSIDRGDKSIIEVLKPLLEFMKKNTRLLDSLQKENEKIFGKGKPS